MPDPTTSPPMSSLASDSPLRRGEAARVVRARRTAELLERLSHATDAGRGRSLRNEVVVVNRPVAEAVAARYRQRGVPEEDLRQAAYEGLIKAVERFDASLHHDFLTYAVPTVRGEVQRYFRDLGWTVRPPRRILELQWSINRTTAELRQQLHRDPRPTEVAQALGVAEREYDEAVAAYGAFHPVSLDKTVTPDSPTTLGELLPVDDAGYATVERRHLLDAALAQLSERDRLIVRRRFWDERKQREIGDELGITQMQVSRLLSRICEDLRQRVGGAAAVA